MKRGNDITVLVGAKNSGKSTRARAIALERPRRIVVDPMREHSRLGVVVRTFDALVRYVEPLRHSRYAVVYQGMSDEDRDAIISLTVAGAPEEAALPDVTLFVDEVDRLCSPQFIPDGLRKVVNYGAHYGVSLIAAARRPRSFHRDITANADRILIGRTQEPADADYLREFIGVELAERVKAITPAAPGEAPAFVDWPGDLASSSSSSSSSSDPPETA